MVKRLSRSLLAVLIVLSVLCSLFAGLTAVAAQSDDFVLYDGKTLADIYIDKADFAQTVRAAGDLKKDVAEVTGKEPKLTNTASGLSKNAVIIGTVGHSELIDRMADSGKLDISGIKDQWEAFTIQIVDSPVSGVDRALVIAGADMRGTIYGIYDLSQQIGVSPWYWWGDVPITRKTSVVLSKETAEKTDMPDVKYRGIFINDEENFEYWSRTLEDEEGGSPGTPNANTYAKIFELLLRLKANTLWPAMHEPSDAFNAILNPETGISYNAERANEYGVIAGSSHCEMLLRNNATEWVPWCEANEGKYDLVKIGNDWKTSYDYTVCPKAMNAYWEEAVARNYKFENMYTIGLRAVHDGAINCRNLQNPTTERKAAVVKQAIEAQVAILEKYEKKYEQETGEKKTFLKVYCSYKEAAEYFQYDLSLPSDTVIIWGDDNYGYVREVSNASELAKYPSAGVYYHVSYLGSPLSYLWIAATPMNLIYEEMTKAYNAGSNDVWILNVGDLKPAEIPMEFFLTMGWDHDRYDYSTIPDYLKTIAARDFGLSDTDAAAVADILDTYYDVSIAKRAEFQGKNQGTEYSLVHYGDEAERQIVKIKEALDKSTAIYDKLPEQYKDAYYQLVHYMVKAIKLTLEKHIYEDKNQLYLSQGRFSSVNAYGQAAMDAYEEILADLKYYNKNVTDGRWDGIMDPYTATRSLPSITAAPSVTMLSEESAHDGIGSVCEGQTYGDENVTLDFYSLTDDKRFIDVFTTGLKKQNYTVTTSNSAIVITRADGTVWSGKTSYTGSVEVEERLVLSVDWSKVGAGVTDATVTVSGDGFEKDFSVKLNKTSVNPAAQSKKGYYEANGEVAIEAEHYSRSVAVNGQEWKVAEGLGRGTDSMKCYPDLSSTSVRIDEAKMTTDAPYLEYDVYFETTGTYDVSFYRIPTLNEGPGQDKSCRIGFQMDSGSIFVFRGNSKVDNEYGNEAWRSGVRENIEILSHTITVPTAGWHTIKVYKSDAGMAFDRFVLRNQSKWTAKSLLGAPESYTSAADYSGYEVGMPPVFSLKDVTYGSDVVEKKFLFDFSADSTVASTGYTGVDTKSPSFAAKSFVWDSDTLKNVKSYTRSSVSASVRDKGFVYGNTAAGFKVNLPKAGKYIVSFAIGDRQSGGVSTSNMGITINGEKLLSGFSLAAGRTTERGFIVDAADAVLDVQLSGSNWTMAALEIGVYKEPENNGGTGAFIADASGSINVEAECALEQSDYAWYTPSTGSYEGNWNQSYGISGTAMYSGPNNGQSFSNNSMSGNSGPKMYYKINFAASGNYDMWVLVKSQSDADDSLLVSLDGNNAFTINDAKDTGGAFKWVKGSQVNVSTAGVHTLSIWEREDGFSIDKFVLTRSSSPSGLGGVMCREGGEVTGLSGLEEAIAKAKALDPDDYIEDRYIAVSAAVASAEALSSNASSSEIENAIKTINRAIGNLIKKTALDADISTGLVAVYDFEDGWTNTLNKSEEAVPFARNNAIPSLTSDADQGGIVQINAGGTGNYTKVSFRNPMYKTDLKDGMTVSFKAKGIGFSTYEFILSASDEINYYWLTGGLYMGYTGSRGYIDSNKPDNLPGPGDKLGYLKNDEWYTITVTFTDDDVTVYVNGGKFLSTSDENYTKGINFKDATRITDVLRWAKTIELGGRNEWWGSDNFFADDFTIYNRALNDDEAAKLALNTVDKSKLIEAIAEAEKEAAKTDTYTAASIAAYKREIEKAKDVIYNGNAGQTTVDNAVTALENARYILIPIGSEPDNAEEVEKLISELPEADKLTIADSSKVYAASAAYGALNEDEKARVSNLSVLIAAEQQLLELSGQPSIRNLTCHDSANSSKWAVRTNLAIGDKTYTDRDQLTLNSIPDYLIGSDWIAASMDSKLWNSGTYLTEFDVYATTYLYVAWDTAVPTPDWLKSDGFEPTDGRIYFWNSNNNGMHDSVLQLYRRPVYAGEHISLGYLGRDRASYLVFLPEYGAEAADTLPQKTLSRTVKVACVGDSITYGSGSSDRNVASYPARLGQYLGDSYDVRNFGLGGTTLINSTDKPYTAQQEYSASLAFQPDIVIIMLGTNDSKPKNNGKLDTEYLDDYRKLIASYQALQSNPKIYIATSPYCPNKPSNPGSNDIIGSVIESQIIPMQKQLAQETGLELIDIFSATNGLQMYPDRVHPHDGGYKVLAKTFYEALFDYLPEGVTVIEKSADFTALDAAVADAGKINTASYAGITVDALNKAIKAAKDLDRTKANQELVDKLTKDIRDAVTGLVLRGDMDKNGVVNVSDILSLKTLIMSGSATAEQLSIGDMDNSGALTVGDILSVKSIIMAG